MVKKTAFKPADPPLMAADPKNVATAVALKELYCAPKREIDPESGEPIEPAEDLLNEFESENIVGDAAMYEAVGLGLSMSEMYGVMLCAKRLGEDPKKNCATVRFFGKVLGTDGDYYVFETSIKEHEPVEDAPETPPGQVPPEPAGEGSNEYTYFVCSHLGGAFTRLPDLTPAAAVAARKIKKYFTGDLTAPVWCYPAFPGDEAMYLRAQVGRIVSATVVSPAGYLVAVGEDEEPKKLVQPGTEDYPDLPAFEEKEDLQEMREPVNWSHRYRYLKKQGPRRAVHAARGCRSRRSRRGSPRAGCGPRAAGHPGRRHRERVRGLGQLRDGGDRRQRPEAARVDVVHQLQRRGSEEPDGGDQEHGVAWCLCGVPGGSQVFKLLRRVRDQERAVRPRASPGGDE